LLRDQIEHPRPSRGPFARKARRTMKVLCFTNIYPSAKEPSAGSFVRDLVEDLRELGTDVHVLAFSGRERRRAYAEAGLALRRTLRDRSFDLVHAHYGLTGILAVSQRRLPVVVTFHGSDTGNPRVRWQGWCSWLVARASTPVFVSRDGAQRLGCVNAAIIPAGVDIELFQPRPRTEARSVLGWQAEGRYILLPGARSNPEKGAALFDATLDEVRRHVPDVTSVSLEGFSREQVAEVMNAVDVTLVTSSFEGSPVAVKESLACNTPVVAVGVGDLPQLLSGLPGCAIVPRDPVALADAVICALASERSPMLRERAEHLSRRRVAKRTIALYESVLGRPMSAVAQDLDAFDSRLQDGTSW
jgi:teichuronic acid biosynthesis glycosyltransferase TuaC